MSVVVETLKHKVIEGFQTRFGKQPEYVIHAPGRVNLIGEHTDYSEGFVMPAAIDRGIAIAFSPREDATLQVFSLDFDELMSADLNALAKAASGWQEYIKGVAWVLQMQGHPLTGWDGVVAGDVPIGAGLSSSAALELAAARAFSIASGIEKSLTDLALVGQKAEGDWVGVRVGIMDQLISAVGRQGHAVQIDCRSLDYAYAPVPVGIGFIVLDTGTRRELAHSAYNTRREECETASAILGVSALRDASLEMLEAKKSELSETVYRRARHVITENERVAAFSEAMRTGNRRRMGELIDACHASLDQDYEVSSRELNIIAEISRRHPACLGARMTGAGFGGCALAVVETDKLEGFEEFVSSVYLAETGIEARIFRVEAGDGVRLL